MLPLYFVHPSATDTDTPHVYYQKTHITTLYFLHSKMHIFSYFKSSEIKGQGVLCIIKVVVFFLSPKAVFKLTPHLTLL